MRRSPGASRTFSRLAKSSPEAWASRCRTVAPSGPAGSSREIASSSTANSAANAPGKTIFDQTAKVIAMCGGWQKIKNSIEEVTVDRFSKNAAKGREGFERVLAISREVFAEQRRQQKAAL